MAKRKLIEAAIPLDAINEACRADKDRKTGTIRNLHKWFAPMPLPAWRALLFATLVDDPDDERERDRLLELIEDLTSNGGDPPSSSAISAARREIARCWPDGPPPVMDPFCGGGSTLIEAGRLGCKTIGSDLNPVAVLISKVLTELLPRVAGSEPLHEPVGRLPIRSRPYDGVAADVIHYAGVVRERARDRLADVYADDGYASEPVAWLWCRTATCPNPACGITTLLTTSWQLSRQRGAERWLEPSVSDKEVVLELAGPNGTPPDPPKTGRGASFVCLRCQASIGERYLAEAGNRGELGYHMTVIVEDIRDRRTFRLPTNSERQHAGSVDRADVPSLAMPDNPRWFSPPLFGMKTFDALLLPRQVWLLDVISQEVARVSQEIRADGGGPEYVAAVQAILGLCVGKLAQASSTLVRWNVRNGPPPKAEPAFGRHDVPMTWDFAEVNPFGGSVGDWEQIVVTALRALPYAAELGGEVRQIDARSAASGLHSEVIVATDPPYFDQIGYADLSDYFYPWLRKSLRGTFPDIFATMATPKTGELVALPTRHNGDRNIATRYFIDGFTATFEHLAAAQAEDVPMLVVYAFKEQSADNAGISRGWAAILEAVVGARLMVTGTWPISGTGATRMVGLRTNALATYVVLVCRPRPTEAKRVTRADFTRLLRSELAGAVGELQHANIAPVDLAQAVIGPGMQVYSRHRSVIETDGSTVGVAAALALINRTLAEVLDEQEGDLDADSRWAVTWYGDHGFDTAPFGKADQLARAKGIAVDSLVEAGIVTSGAGRVALIARDALRERWDPATDRRATAWEAVQYLVRALEEGGERGAADLYARLGGLADPARELAYRLFQMAEKKGRTDEAIAYNGLVTSWSEIARLADDLPRQSTTTTEVLF
jgi:putative DNA methylase